MKRVLSKNEPLPLQNHTFRETNGIDVSWRGGDLLIAGFGNWFDAPFFKLRVWVNVPFRILPFIRWRFGKTVGYLGAKAWGVDSEHYLNWIDAKHVRVGSVALVISARIDADDH